MALSTQQFRQWNVEQVSQWLETIHLSSLIPNFERLQITGSDLSHMDDSFLKERLRVTKPAEVAALKGAIAMLMDQNQQPLVPANNRGGRKVSVPPKPPFHSPYVRERSGSFDKPRTIPAANARRGPGVIPSTIPRNYTVTSGDKIKPATREPQLKIAASAPEVLDDHCRYSGWIRKQGGGYKNWRKRYLVLRIGCLYYFANETASQPKGCFTLSGYKTEYCQEPDITKKFKWTLKILPVNPALRTYYIAVGAKRELFAWKQAIDEEILACERRRPSDDQPAATHMGLDGGDMGEGSSEEEGEDDEPLYDEPGKGDEYNQGGDSPIYTNLNEEEDSYTRIDDEGLFPHTAAQLPPGAGKRDAPTVPIRSAVSLGHKQTGAHHSTHPAVVKGDEAESTYLPIIGSGSGPSSASEKNPLTTDRPKLASPPSQGFITEEKAAVGPTPSCDAEDYEDDSMLDGDDMYPDDSDAYYIMIRKPEELFPPFCVFDQLARPEAERLLRTKGRDGTYLIRAGVHAGTDKVLSVWHIDKCRHYKLFKDENSRYSLTQGQTFGTIPELLQYYMLSAHLPRSEFYLMEPYYPQDH